MKTEKRGSEKLLSSDNGLCSLTAEELVKVAGGAQSANPFELKDYFPRGIFPPDLLSEISTLNMIDNPRRLLNTGKIPAGKSISNGF